MDFEALECARHLIENGVPVFIAKPAIDGAGNWLPEGGHHGSGYFLPKKWQDKVPDPSVVDRWKPGDALCAVMGHLIDLIDVDPRADGDKSLVQLRNSGKMPIVYGQAATPSGGSHFFIASMNVRSLDRLMPGLDIKAGTTAGRGRGFAFIAPTVKRSKATGELVKYVWEIQPELDELALVGGDTSGDELAQAITTRNPVDLPDDTPTYDGPTYDELPPEEQRLADAYVTSIVEQWREKLAEAVDWAEGETDDQGRGWEALSKDSAWVLARLAVTTWTALTPEQAEQMYHDILPDELAADPKCKGKWTDSLCEKALTVPIAEPWWKGFLLAPTQGAKINPVTLPDFPAQTDDAYLAVWVTHKAFELEWCWAGKGLGWMQWDGRRWVQREEEQIREEVRQVMQRVNQQALAQVQNRAAMGQYLNLLSSKRIASIATLMRGTYIIDGREFDQQPDLLNVANGVVDLRTGDLLPHDPKWKLSRITETSYEPNAKHDDWLKCLQALDEEVQDWFQMKVGQAATGHAASDDLMPICQGGGSNGKTTIIAALRTALGEHMTTVPEKLLRANPNEHPTELMTLFGARVAVIDETPETAQLNVPRLKQIVGTDRIKARLMHKDFVEWRPTHTLFVMTNYVPTIVETDKGTWRRLALVRFTKTFPKDDRFRARVSSGHTGLREAVLAWVVKGSVRWYSNERSMMDLPARVLADTAEWRAESDLVMSYLRERVVFEPGRCILTNDLLDDVNGWLIQHSQRPWSSRLLTSRFMGHELIAQNGVTKYQTRLPADGQIPGISVRFGTPTDAGTFPVVWSGMRWRDEGEE